MLEIQDYNELMALHKLLMERHYKLEFHSDELIGSSYLADLSNRVLDNLIKYDEEKGGPERTQSWKRWRALDSTRPEWSMLLQRLKGIGKWWRRQSVDEKKNYILILLSPYTVTLEQLNELVTYGDQNN